MAKKLTAKEELVGLVGSMRVLVNTVDIEVTKLVEGGVKASSTRARKALQEIKDIAQRMRKVVIETRNAM